MTRGVPARIALAVVLLLGVSVVFATDERADTASSAPTTLQRNAVLTTDATGDEPLAIAALRGVDDTRASSSRLATVVLATAMVMAAIAAWRRQTRARHLALVRHVVTGSRRRAPPVFRSA
jgi:hypothetical protein